MALDNLTSLTVSIGTWLRRSDYTSIAPDLILLAEQEFNDELRARQQESQTSLTITSGYLPHPTDWLDWKLVEVTTADGTHRVSPDSEENVSDKSVGRPTTQPYQFVIRGDRTYIRPGTDSSGYPFPTVYYAKVPALTSAATTNWLLTRYPGAYLYGALSHAKAYFEEAAWQFYENKKKEIIARINRESRGSRYGKQALTMKSDVRVT